MKVLLSGATGLIGSSLFPFLVDRGDKVTKLVRKSGDSSGNEILWNPAKGMIDAASLEGFDAVIHLAGENIASGRWTPQKKKAIYESRVSATGLLCRTLAGLKKPPKVFLGASAVGIYGNRGEEVLTDASLPGQGFLADVCKEWEAATLPVYERGVRVIALRCGVVLSPRGGALKKMLTPFTLGLGGILGSGKQYVSWIAEEDLLRMIEYILLHESVQGPVNAVSPRPVNNLEWTKTLGKLLHRPTFMSMPAFAARILFGEMADVVLLASQRAIPKKIRDAGFEFLYPNVEDALGTCLSNNEIR